MKAGKWITAAAVLTLSTSLAVAAPHGGGHGMRHGGKGRGEMGAHFAKKLNLTDAQKAQVKEINESFREENKAFFEQMRQTRTDFRAAKQASDTARLEALKGTMQAQRAQMKQLREQHVQRLLTTLTPEQRQEWEKMKAEREARRGERGRGHGRHGQK